MTDTNTAQMVADLQSTNGAINAQGWVAPGLGRPNSALGFLNSGVNPLSGLAAAGLGWFMPLVSFLGDGLTQLQGGDGASVTSGSQDFGQAGTDIGGLADSYRASTTAQTADWTGAAADDYRSAAAQHADGVSGLGQGSTTTASAIIGAGQVVAQAISEVLELIGEAVSQIVPIMTQAVARAGETNGESIAEAIPPCVGIAVEYALRIAAKLAALLASGDNLMKLVQGGMAVVDMIQQAMSTISNQSVQPSLDSAMSSGSGQQQDAGGSQNATDAADGANAMADWNSGGNGGGSSDPASSGGSGDGGSAGGLSPSAGSAIPDIPQQDTATHSSSVVPPISSAHTTMPDTSRYVSHSGVSSSAMPSGGMPSDGMLGGAARGAASGARAGVGLGADTEREKGSRPQTSRSSGGSGGAAGGAPMAGMGSRALGDKDKDHQRAVELTEDGSVFGLATPDIADSTITNDTFSS